MLNLTSHRSEGYQFDLLSLDDKVIGSLDGVEQDSGSLSFSVYADIRGSGNVTVNNADVDWTQHRVRISYLAGEGDEQIVVPLITAVPRAPIEAHKATGWSVDLELYDKTLILSEDTYGVSYAVAAGTNPITAVTNVITSTGLPAPELLTATTDVLATPMVWEAGTSKLKIVNGLLDAANYFALYADGYGRLHADPYTSPDARPSMWNFTGSNAVYLPEWTRDRDVFSVPNRYVCVGTTNGETPALSAVATDTSDGPFSYAARGRWITRADLDVDAASQGVLDGIAQRRLFEAQHVTETLTFEHPWLPFGLNEVVMFGNVRAVVWKQEMNLSIGGLIRSTARRLA